MLNPFNPPHPIFWLICPTHQLKNMINALFSSKPGGTKSFLMDGVTFGWSSIIKMFERECERINSGSTRMVPKLKEVHVIRDAWTKLNVTPAKIMQQENVLTELFSYLHDNPNQSLSDGTKAVLSYLESCSKIFENGFLSHSKITDINCDTMKSINEGYKFFTRWLDQIRCQDSSFDLKVNTQTKFLAWQTFDLLRIDIYGFNMFCKHFLKKHPGYFVSPLRVSGSAVETLFSQFKYSSGGKLDAANYGYSRAVSLVKQVTSTHHSGKDYRDGQLHINNLPLTKKVYNKKD
ncbi:PREDICTED: uncharacterized protein LOC109584761 [Amphimedon queenslandica]|uniref:Uncharacterized protein n=1 Tax=Amphimedon queenslandica TaxID=400682 RepID=A0AAN0JHA5_AMPQE|nr:PREDICTED: uncharacterized protein LOC109584761 [Amphimedon queenslandica]|eukprot:XP_019856162.1 PREDICTED: uncharacterized protein LOC109584761 [Amphimedon queenslandica]